MTEDADISIIGGGSEIVMETAQQNPRAEDAEIPFDQSDVTALQALHEYFRKFWAEGSQEPRARYDAFIAATPIAEGVTFRSAENAEPPGVWCEPNASAQHARDRAILYLHGGAYTMGSAEAYRGFVSQIATRARCPAFILEYPRAPEAAIPAALDLAVRALASVLKRYPRVAIVGDSAGGGLTLATLAARRRDLQVCCAVVFSPWTDLTLSGASISDRAGADVLLDPAVLAEAARGYVGAASASDPRASPLLGIPGDLPPVLIQVGTEEILLDDSRRYAASARRLGAAVSLERWAGMHHVFQLDVKSLSSSRRALDRAAGFLLAHFD